MASVRAPAPAAEFRQLLDKLPAAAYTCDAQGCIDYFNRHAVELWGREPALEDPAERFCGSFKLFSLDGEPVPHDECWMARALHEGREFNGCEVLIERPDGSRRTVLAHANPFLDSGGRVTGAVNVLVDISERKRAEDARRETDRRKSDFLAVLAHELRNPLAPLRNGLQIIRLASHDSRTIEETHAMMERQFSHMVRLIDDLLDVSKIANGKIELRKQQFDLCAAVRDALESCRPLIDASNLELTTSMPPHTLDVEADRTRLTQVFTNLLTNSIKFTPPGGSIRIVAELQGSDAVVSIEDNGAGISTDVLPKVFEMFVQGDRGLERPAGGLGLGLNLVRGLVEMHGGHVEAKSAGPGEGSCFTVRLPARLPEEPPAEPQPGGASAAARAKSRILVVDDNIDSALSLSMMLRIMGHEACTAHDGLEAVETASNMHPDVLLLDIGLPKLNGYEVCRRIRSEPWGRRTMIVALTGWGQEEDKRRSKEAGFDLHMVKPIDPAALERLLSGLPRARA